MFNTLRIRSIGVLTLAFLCAGVGAQTGVSPTVARTPEPPTTDIGDPPEAPAQGETPPQPFAQLSAKSSNSIASFARTGGFDVDLTDRQHVRDFFNSIYLWSNTFSAGFDGDVGNCIAGDTADAYKNAILLRINFYRELAGVDDNIALNEGFNMQAQEAALMMSAARALSHTPSASWPCFTQAGADGAGSSNLALGNAGPDAIDAYMIDRGSNNTAVGHRRWILHPPTREMGTGDVAASGETRSNALWVFDSNIWQAQEFRDDFVAWPPPGYVPQAVVPIRWSFGLPGANFSNATVSMSTGSESIPVSLEPQSEGFSMNTLVWHPTSLNPDVLGAWPAEDDDAAYMIEISNVLVNGVSQDFSYTVTVFDAEVPGPNAIETELSGPIQVSVAQPANFNLSSVAYAQSFEQRTSTLMPHSRVEGAENGLTYIEDGTNDDYSLVSNSVAAAGGSSFHLAHTGGLPQSFQLTEEFLVSNESELSFESRLGWATSDQVARVQASTDGGSNWRDIYAQEGSDGQGETSFSTRLISLTDYAGRVIKLRFLYDLGFGSYYPQSSDGVGFYVDEIELTHAQKLDTSETQSLGAQEQFQFTAPAAGDYLLEARYLAWDGFPGASWGPSLLVNAAANNDFDGDGVDDDIDEDDDNDGLPDLWEQQFGLNPRDPADANLDGDSDGLSHAEEFALGTLPNESDSDGDGFTDGEEVLDGSDPLDDSDPASMGLPMFLLFELLRP